MTDFILIGLALFGGQLIPWPIRLLMVIGGVASLVNPLLSRAPQRDGGASYPYLTQDNVLDGDDDD